MTKGGDFGASENYFSENVISKILNSNPNQVIQNLQGIYKIIRIEQTRGRLPSPIQNGGRLKLTNCRFGHDWRTHLYMLPFFTFAMPFEKSCLLKTGNG